MIALCIFCDSARCAGADGLDSTSQSIGSIDEFDVVSKKLQENEIGTLNITTH
jgi:hypothetical protein